MNTKEMKRKISVEKNKKNRIKENKYERKKK